MPSLFVFICFLSSIHAFSVLPNLLSHVSRKSDGIVRLRLSGSVEKEFAQAAAAALPKNVLGGTLQCCCVEPRTGFYRDGFCTTGICL